MCFAPAVMLICMYVLSEESSASWCAQRVCVPRRYRTIPIMCVDLPEAEVSGSTQESVHRTVHMRRYLSQTGLDKRHLLCELSFNSLVLQRSHLHSQVYYFL